MRPLALLSLAALLLISGVPACAQFVSGVDQLSLALSPQHPRPYETVTVSLSSTILDLASSDITFYVDGKVVAENERSATFAVGGPGTKTTVRVVAITDGATDEISLTILPTDVMLVVEPSTSAHPLYAGAVLPAPEAGVRLVALTDFRTSPGTRIPPESLIYNWKFGDRILAAESGIGKGVLIATAPTRYRDARVTLTVTTRDKALVGQATVIVTPVTPLVRIYRHDPLLGIDFARALEGTFVMPGSEEAFRAVPYHFAGLPVISWTLNGTDTGTDPDLTVRTTGVQKGTALVGVSVDGDGIFAHAEERLGVEFGKAAETLFGF